MDIKSIKDFGNELYRSSNLFSLLDKYIFVIASNGYVYKFKIVGISLSKINENNYFIELICSPEYHQNLGFLHDDEYLNYEDFGKTWFYSLADAKRYSKQLQYNKQMQLPL